MDTPWPFLRVTTSPLVRYYGSLLAMGRYVPVSDQLYRTINTNNSTLSNTLLSSLPSHTPRFSSARLRPSLPRNDTINTSNSDYPCQALA